MNILYLISVAMWNEYIIFLVYFVTCTEDKRGRKCLTLSINANERMWQKKKIFLGIKDKFLMNSHWKKFYEPLILHKWQIKHFCKSPWQIKSMSKIIWYLRLYFRKNENMQIPFKVVSLQNLCNLLPIIMDFPKSSTRRSRKP